MPYLGNQALWGLHPFRNRSGTAPRIGYYAVAASNTAIGEGCLVSKAATTPWGVNISTFAASAYPIIGVAACNWAASTTGFIPIYDDPDQLYTITCHGATTAAEQLESLGQYAGISATYTNTYDSTYDQGKTGMIGGVGTTAPTPTTSLPLQIMGWINMVGETTTATYAQAIVRISPMVHIFSHDMSQGSGARPA